MERIEEKGNAKSHLQSKQALDQSRGGKKSGGWLHPKLRKHQRVFRRRRKGQGGGRVSGLTKGGVNVTDQIDQYNEILDKLDEALAELNKADRDFDLTDIQGQSVIQLRQIYDAMIGDVLDLERESF